MGHIFEKNLCTRPVSDIILLYILYYTAAFNKCKFIRLLTVLYQLSDHVSVGQTFGQTQNFINNAKINQDNRSVT